MYVPRGLQTLGQTGEKNDYKYTDYVASDKAQGHS